MSIQFGDFTSSKVVDGQCALPKTQKLCMPFVNTYIIELKSHI